MNVVRFWVKMGRRISLTLKEADRIMDIINYYIEEEQIVPEEESLEEVDSELSKIVEKLDEEYQPWIKYSGN